MHAPLSWAHAVSASEPGNLSHCPGCSLGIFFYTLLQVVTLKHEHWPSRSKALVILG